MTYRRRHCYRNLSNKVKKTKTPGAYTRSSSSLSEPRSVAVAVAVVVSAVAAAGRHNGRAGTAVLHGLLFVQHGHAFRPPLGRVPRWLLRPLLLSSDPRGPCRVRPQFAGGRIVAHYHEKKSNAPVCGEPHCEVRLAGVKSVRPKERLRLHKRERTVSRAYGGVLCMNCTRSKCVPLGWRWRALLCDPHLVVGARSLPRRAVGGVGGDDSSMSEVGHSASLRDGSRQAARICRTS